MELLDWLTVIGGSGGLVYWWDRWRDRPRINVRVVRESSDDGYAEVTLEVENQSGEMNSLQPGFSFDGLSPTKKWEQYQFAWDSGEDRALPPFEPRTLTARARDPMSKFGFLWLRRYHIPATRGRTKVKRLRWVEGPRIGFLRYWVERVLFKSFGQLYLKLVKDDLEELKSEPLGGRDV